MPFMRVVKKPIEVEAWKLDSRVLMHEPKDPDVPGWVWDSIANGKLRWSKDYNDWAVWSLEGLMVAKDHDFLIRGVIGEIYPCKGDIFEETYEIVKE